MRNRTTAALVAIWLLTSASLHGEKTITIAVVMDQATQAEREPLRSYLSKALGSQVSIAAPDSFRDTVAQLANGTYDFACLGALIYIRTHAKYGVIPLVQRTVDKNYYTVFITATKSSIHSLRDLKGKQFAFGDKDSTSAYMMPYYELQKAGIDPETYFHFRFSGSHPATAAMVETGVVDAGAIDETVLNFLISTAKIDGKKVRIFYTSKPYVDYVWVARKEVPEAERERFIHALLALTEGKDDAILKILRAKRFVLANDQEYAEARKIAHELNMF
ncbi:MAG: phosphate/phosphite/phosphonate ABC transporter substrate-binding protein [Candidatus Sulfotelmatobacter sp.]